MTANGWPRTPASRLLGSSATRGADLVDWAVAPADPRRRHPRRARHRGVPHRRRRAAQLLRAVYGAVRACDGPRAAGSRGASARGQADRRCIDPLLQPSSRACSTWASATSMLPQLSRDRPLPQASQECRRRSPTGTAAAAVFNRELGSWNVSQVTSMSNMSATGSPGSSIGGQIAPRLAGRLDDRQIERAAAANQRSSDAAFGSGNQHARKHSSSPPPPPQPSASAAPPYPSAAESAA